MDYFSSPQTLAYLDTVSIFIISKCDCSKFICVPHATPRFLCCGKTRHTKGLSNFSNDFQLNSNTGSHLLVSLKPFLVSLMHSLPPQFVYVSSQVNGDTYKLK